ncbi:MAG: hypothetical protein A3H97_20105 [Acidobacteria bacterium RIFCSPLOWO2_02_FULL_65_29]|nr:MAG: hypothetical protein A3H97_20105 [Acidobacteria bacterium RIFCSPLOWO2_02_FULL_65_29]
MRIRATWAAALGIGFGLSLAPHAQTRRPPIASGKPKVDLVETVGCVDRKAGNPVTWWLTRAADPRITTAGFVTTTDVESAKSLPLGTNALQLIGVSDFVDAEALLQEPERSRFTTSETANATGQLRAGRKVLVKGLFIEADGQKRINLTQVISLAAICGS